MLNPCGYNIADCRGNVTLRQLLNTKIHFQTGRQIGVRHHKRETSENKQHIRNKTYLSLQQMCKIKLYGIQ